jgi:hypothetical protein
LFDSSDGRATIGPNISSPGIWTVLDRSRGVDTLIQRASSWTPREAAVFLLDFEARFRAVAGGEPTRVERLILTSLLRRRVAQDP